MKCKQKVLLTETTHHFLLLNKLWCLCILLYSLNIVCLQKTTKHSKYCHHSHFFLPNLLNHYFLAKYFGLLMYQIHFQKYSFYCDKFNLILRIINFNIPISFQSRWYNRNKILLSMPDNSPHPIQNWIILSEAQLFLRK